MSKRIRGLVEKLGVLALFATYLLTGCGGKDIGENIEANSTQSESPPVSEKDITPNEKINTVEGVSGIGEGNKVKDQMTKGLFDTKNPFVVSTMTLGKLFETYHITNEGEKVPNVSKQEQRQALEQKYNGENIPVDESEVISLRASDIFAPHGLDIEIFSAYPNIKIDAIGMVDLSRLHIRFKGDNLEAFNMYLKTPTSPSPLPSFEWFLDIYEGEQYWNAVFFEISEQEELEEAYLVLEICK